MNNTLIQSMPVQRDKDGHWYHPDMPDFDEGQEAEWKAWLAAQGLEVTQTYLEWEDIDHPAYIAYFDEESCDWSMWNPTPPSGEGWFTLIVQDTEDGPCWVWARQVSGTTGAESIGRGGSDE